MSQDFSTSRWVLFAILAILFAGVFFARLIDLQLIRGSYFYLLAQENRIRRIPLKAPRGEIKDRFGETLVRNIPIYKLATFGQGGVVVETQEITREAALNIQSGEDDAAAKILIEWGREYRLAETGVHVLGYVGEATKEEVGGVKNSKCPGLAKRSGAGKVQTYQLGDLVGRSGVEKEYECVLKGINGEELVEVDTRGRIIRLLGRKEPVAGQDLALSLSGVLQKKAYESLQGALNEKGTAKIKDGGGVVRGALVVSQSQTGEVLAMVSSPSFDPNSIGNEYPKLANDKNLPLFNRAIGGVYPPGSTFKIVTAAAGLEEGRIDKDWLYNDTGQIVVNNFAYKNWYFTQYGRTEGLINVVRAITRSTDTFFYKVGELVHVDTLASWARKFGLGKSSGIDLPGEVEGLVPDSEWKLETKGERWFLGNTYHMSIGQADLLTTPLQVNQMTSVVASGGKLCAPNVLKTDNLPDGSQGYQLKACEDLGLSQETLQLIKEGMIGACSSGGTAFPFFQLNEELPEGGKVACKTGTAEVGGSDKTHAWLTAFVEGENAIVATALVEEGGEGSRVAAPVVKEVFEYWLKNH